jgi:hypothetical protein
VPPGLYSNFERIKVYPVRSSAIAKKEIEDLKIAKKVSAEKHNKKLKTQKEEFGGLVKLKDTEIEAVSAELQAYKFKALNYNKKLKTQKEKLEKFAAEMAIKEAELKEALEKLKDALTINTIRTSEDERKKNRKVTFQDPVASVAKADSGSDSDSDSDAIDESALFGDSGDGGEGEAEGGGEGEADGGNGDQGESSSDEEFLWPAKRTEEEDQYCWSEGEDPEEEDTEEDGVYDEALVKRARLE